MIVVDINIIGYLYLNQRVLCSGGTGSVEGSGVGGALAVTERVVEYPRPLHEEGVVIPGRCCEYHG